MTDEKDQLDALIEAGKQHIENVTEATLISVILDMSGSMHGVQNETIVGFNQLIEDQKKEPGKCFVSLTVFDTAVNVLYTGTPLQDVPKLTTKEYRPDGLTSLYDAQGVTVRATEKYLESLDDDERPAKVLFVTMTDGGENSSVEYTAESLKTLISQKEEEGWDFAYTGANQDSFSVARTMGVAKGMTQNYTGTAAGTQQNIAVASASISAYRGASTMDAAWENRKHNFWQEPETDDDKEDSP